MEPDANMTEDFKKRRNQKNWVMLALILGCVALIWGITLLKLQALPDDKAVTELPEMNQEMHKEDLK